MSGVLEHLRTFVRVVDQLRDVGVGDYIKLPRICVVGSQSSGKSSLLEAIVGVDFLPRGEGIVTRRPIEIRLVHDSEQAEMVCIFEGEPNNRMTDFEEVRQKIEKYTNDVAGDRKGIVDEPILIQIIGSTCPDLTLIDLPGITRVPLRNSDQNEDIEAITKDMVLRYAEDDRTLILAVIPANQDISTSDALQIAKKVDPKGIRTLGVVTKIDIMDRGTNAVSTLKGEEISLRLGYIGVKLRSHQDIASGVSISRSKEVEYEFFISHNSYKCLSQQYWGIETLTKRLVALLYEHIKRCLPKINFDIGEKRRVAQNRRMELGLGPPENATGCTQALMKYAKTYAVVISHQIKGVYEEEYDEYYDKNGSSAGSDVKEIFNSLLLDSIDCDISQKIHDDEIVKTIRRYEGDSITGFPSRDTFKCLMTPKLQLLKAPIFDCLEAVSDRCDTLCAKTVSRVFSKCELFGELVLEVMDGALQEKKEKTKDLLDSLAKAELKYMFTNNNSYVENLERFVGREQADQSDLTEVEPGYPVEVPNPTYFDLNMVKDMRGRINGYYHVVAQSLRETVPKFIGMYLIRSLLDDIESLIQERVLPLSLSDQKAILGEPPNIGHERAILDKQLKTLEKASVVLARELATFKYSGELDTSIANDITAALDTQRKTREQIIMDLDIKENQLDRSRN